MFFHIHLPKVIFKHYEFVGNTIHMLYSLLV